MHIDAEPGWPQEPHESPLLRIIHNACNLLQSVLHSLTHIMYNDDSISSSYYCSEYTSSITQGCMPRFDLLSSLSRYTKPQSMRQQWMRGIQDHPMAS